MRLAAVAFLGLVERALQGFGDGRMGQAGQRNRDNYYAETFDGVLPLRERRAAKLGQRLAYHRTFARATVAGSGLLYLGNGEQQLVERRKGAE